MNKKFLSLVLALVMVLGTFGNVFAAAAKDKKEVKDVPKLTSTDAKVQWLIDNSIVIGNADKDGKPTGDMDLKSPIRRDAVAKMLVYAIGENDLATKLQGVYRPFPDVEVSNIMNGYIAAAASRTSLNGVAIINGYEDGMFRPTNNVTYAELAKMLVVAIDKDLTPAKAASYSWYQDWINRAVQLGIFDGLSIDKANAPATRREAFAMIYNAFYQLGQIKPMPVNETRGIISEYYYDKAAKAGKLVINQGDFKKEYTVDVNTNFVDLAKMTRSEKWLSTIGEKKADYYVGSLVRVIADEKGLATHIIEMGNPVEGIKMDKAWVDLGNKTFDKAQSWHATTVGKTVKASVFAPNEEVKIDFTNGTVAFKEVAKDNSGAFVAAGTASTFKVTSNTAIYVADFDVNKLTQVKDLDAVKALLDLNKKELRAYVGYEVVPGSGVKEAKVLVLNDIADPDTKSEIVRVVTPSAGINYNITFERPAAKAGNAEKFSVQGAKFWPHNPGVVAKDVFKLVNKGEDFEANPAKIISYENDPIVEVESFRFVDASKGIDKVVKTLGEANAIQVRDKGNNGAIYGLPTDYAKFFGDQIEIGAKIQYAVRGVNVNGAELDVISVLDKTEDLRGLIFGKDLAVKEGIFVKYDKDDSELARVYIKVDGVLKEYVTAQKETDLQALADGDLVSFKETGIKNKKFNVPEIRALKQEKTAAAIAGEYDTEFAKLPAVATIIPDNYKKADDTEKLRQQILGVRAKLAELNETNKASKLAALNAVIEAFNKLPNKAAEIDLAK